VKVASDILSAFVRELADNGVKFTLDIAGKVLPVTLRIEVDHDD
jgi:predicted nucleotidyltransferase